MGASMVKSCFGGDCLWTPSDPTPRVCKRTPAVGPRQYDTTRRAHILKQPQERYVSPTKNAARLPAPHHHSQLQHWPCNSVPSREALRKLSPYEHQQQQWYATERRKLKNLASSLSSSVRGPRRERWGSRESTCSSSSGTEDEHGITIGHNDRDVRRRSRRSPPHVRSWASTAFSEESFYHSFHENNATPASVNSARRLSRASSPSFGFEDLLPECYVLEELIGSGTTSKCYRCRRTTDGRLFACKIINKRRLAFDCHQRDEIARQLRREVDVLRRLDHPNIAKLEDAFENETYILLVMELLEGGELFETIIDRVRLTESDAKHVAKSVLSAISYMHAQGIVHRDIKPENLLLTTNCSPGKPLHVKIVDFGFASSIDTKTTMTSFLGTGGYLAPEILLQRPYTSAVDMWAFGVLLFLMLCGRLPFTTSTQLQPNQRLSAVFRLTFPEKYWRGVSRPARDLLQKILVLNPSYRLSAADALNHRWFQNE